MVARQWDACQAGAVPGDYKLTPQLTAIMLIHPAAGEEE
jgi:hypothetical protein